MKGGRINSKVEVSNHTSAEGVLFTYFSLEIMNSSVECSVLVVQVVSTHQYYTG